MMDYGAAPGLQELSPFFYTNYRLARIAIPSAIITKAVNEGSNDTSESNRRRVSASNMVDFIL